MGASQGTRAVESKTPEHWRQPSRKPPRRIKKGRMGVILVVIVLILLVVLLVPQIRIPLLELLDPSSYREYPESVEFTVERSIRITNVINYTVDIPKPEDYSSIQEVVSLNSAPSYTPENRYGDNWMVWQENGDADITITYRMRTETAVWNIESSDVMILEEAMTTDDTFQLLADRYNRKEWKIDPTNPEIVSLAEQLDNGGTIYDQTKSIFEYLDKNFDYKTVDRAEVKAPTETLHDKNGDCDDMSFLFIATSRAMGIPSWIELGALYDQQSNQWVGHAWIALYLPLKDEARSGVVNIDIVNREFLVRGANRFSDWSSDGGYTDWHDFGTVEEDEWHLYDYYYMYEYNPLPGTVYYSDESAGLDYEESGSVRVKLGGEQSTPAFELFLLIPLVIIAYVVIFLARKNQKR